MAKSIDLKIRYTAKEFLLRLSPLLTEFKVSSDSRTDGIPMGEVFKLAKEFISMPLKEIEILLDNKSHVAKVGAVSIMDFQARSKKAPSDLKRELYELYIRKHDCIDYWDLVDRSAPYVLGGYLFDKSRAPLYKLAKSKNVWERRTAIVATYFFIRQNDIDDTFKISELLVYDKEHFVNTAVGSWVREAGKQDEERLIAFINKHYKKMPRVTLRYAVEKLDKKIRDAYLKR
jgi:3-methyladenine DNA glycosylase AlkD